MHKLSSYEYVPDKLSLNGVTLASERTSNSIDMRARSDLAIKVHLSARTAVTAVLVSVDEKVVNAAGTDVWIPLQAISVSSGTGTLTDFVGSKTVTDVDHFEIRLTEVNAKDVRIRVSGTAGAAGDVVSVWARVS